MNATTTRRGFIAGGLAAGAAVQPLFTKAEGDFDDSLTLLLADVHIKGGETIWYSEGLFRKLVADVLKLRPLPRRCLILGDIAYVRGRAKDYDRAAPLLKLLEDAGIELVLGMGNHDRRETFFEKFPKYAETTKVPGRVVSEVKLADVDVVMLDSLRSPDEGKGVVPGEVGGGQMEWLAEYLKAQTRPVILCAHHKAQDLGLVDMLEGSECVAGYIYGHHHHWATGWTRQNTKTRAVPTCCLPSASLWGDIGYALMRTTPRRARILLVQRDYVAHDYRDQPVVRPPERSAQFDALLEDRRRGLMCSFALGTGSAT